MSNTDATAVTIPPKPRKKRHSHHHHHHRRHHHHHHFDNGSNCLFWGFIVFFFLIMIGWMIASFWYPWGQPVVVEDPDRFNSSSAFVFRKRHSFAEKHKKCKPFLETWDALLAMCVPNFNTPTAFDSALMDQSVPVCSSFVGNVCGNQKGVDRLFSYAYHRNQRMLQGLMEGTPFYESCLVKNTRVEQQIELKHVMDTIMGRSGLTAYTELPAVFGRLARYGYTAPLVFSIERHPTKSGELIPFVGWDGFKNISLPMVRSAFTRVGQEHDLNKMERAYKVGKAIAERNTEPLDKVTDYHDYIKTYFESDLYIYVNLPSWNMRPTNTFIGWSTFLQAMENKSSSDALKFSNSQKVWVAGFPYLQWLLEDALHTFDLRDWRAYVEFSIIYHCHEFNPLLPDHYYYRKWDIQGPVGPEGRIYHRIPRGNWSAPHGAEQCTEITQYMLPGLVADAYQSDPLVQRDVRNMTTLLMRGTKTNVRVAESDEWEKEPFADRLSPHRYDHNMNLVRRHRVQRNLQSWRTGKLDSAIALFSGFTPDVYYCKRTDTLTVFPGLLQPPLYNALYNDISKYAILGATIGSEYSQMEGVSRAYHSLSLEKMGDKQHFWIIYAQARCSADVEHILKSIPEFSEAYPCGK